MARGRRPVDQPASGQAVYTVGEAAAKCGVSVSLVKRWIKAGTLSAYRLPGKQGEHRVHRAELLMFADNAGIKLVGEISPVSTVFISATDRDAIVASVAAAVTKFGCSEGASVGELAARFGLSAQVIGQLLAIAPELAAK